MSTSVTVLTPAYGKVSKTCKIIKQDTTSMLIVSDLWYQEINGYWLHLLQGETYYNKKNTDEKGNI